MNDSWDSSHVAALLLAGMSSEELRRARATWNHAAAFLDATDAELAAAGVRRRRPVQLPDGFAGACPGDPDYPTRLTATAPEPVAVLLGGNRDLIGRGGIAIVGDQSATNVARHACPAAAAAAPAGSTLIVALNSPVIDAVIDNAVHAHLVGVGAAAAPASQRILAAGGAVVADATGRTSVQQLQAALADVVVVVEANRGGPAVGAAVWAARQRRSLLVLRPRAEAAGMAGTDGLFELTRPYGARSTALGADVDEMTLAARIPFADGVVERLADLPDYLRAAVDFASTAA